MLGWFAVLAPSKTPPAVVTLLNAEINKMIAKPAIVTKFQELGAEPMGGSPEQAAAFIQSEEDKWGKVIREIGIKAN